MLAKFRERLAALAKALGVQKPLRARAVRRMKANHKRQAKAEHQRDAASTRADELRAAGHLAKARRKDRKALHLDAVAQKYCARSIFWKGRAKVLAQRIHGINTERAALEADLAKWRAEHEPKIEGNKVRGGDVGERFILANKTAAANCASGKRRNFYDQGGAWDCKHEIAPGPEYDERSDCSQYGAGICWSAGLPDPNATRYTGGYTGTAMQQNNGWKIVSEKAMRAKGWGIVIYLSYPGDSVGHHWENYIGEGGDLTIGHGSAPVDPGRINLFGDGLYACLIYDPK